LRFDGVGITGDILLKVSIDKTEVDGLLIARGGVTPQRGDHARSLDEALP
jgi:hypothetical protein